MGVIPDRILVYLRLFKTVLINVTENRRHKVFVVIVLLVLWHIRRTILLRRQQKTEYVRKLRNEGYLSPNNGPLLTFSGAGMLGFYYQGVSAYLLDNFNLDNCRFAGISAGASTANALCLKVPVEAMIVCGLRWFKHSTSTPLGMYFNNTEKFVGISMKVCKEFNISEELVRERHRENPPFFGTTNIGVFPWKHEILTNFSTREEGFHAMSCSMRVLPFFSTPGYFRKKILLDGLFSALFTIPIEYYDIDDDFSNNQHKIIRITPSSRVKFADIKPNYLKKSQCFEWGDVFRKPELTDIYTYFERGYLDAMQARKRLISKGLIPKKQQFNNYKTPRYFQSNQMNYYNMNPHNNNNNNNGKNNNVTSNNDSGNSSESKSNSKSNSPSMSASSGSQSTSSLTDSSLFFDSVRTPHGKHFGNKSDLYRKCRHCGNILQKDISNPAKLTNNELICEKCGNIDKLSHWLEYLKQKGPEILYDENDEEYQSDFRDLVEQAKRERKRNDGKGAASRTLPVSGKSMRRLLRSEWEKDDLQANQFNIIAGETPRHDSELDIADSGNLL